jgi:hypothetical protein
MARQIRMMRCQRSRVASRPRRTLAIRVGADRTRVLSGTAFADIVTNTKVQAALQAHEVVEKARRFIASEIDDRVNLCPPIHLDIALFVPFPLAVSLHL